MIKRFCDRCEKEVGNGPHGYSIEIPNHVVEEQEKGFFSGYVDQEFNPVSGRDEHFDLCPKCYNIVYHAAFRAIRGEKKNV